MAKKTEETTAIIPVSQWAIAQAKDIAEVITENFGEAGILPTDLEKLTVPSGGATSWTVMTDDGEEEVKDVIAIIAFHQPVRLYWESSMDESGGGAPPDCYSNDCITGIGTPGGACDVCPFNEWGSGSKGEKSKACQERRQLFLIRPDTLFPTLLSVPPSSLKPFKKYLMSLTTRGRKVSDVYTRISLAKDKSEKGIAYSKVVFAAAGVVSPEDKAIIAANIEGLKSALS